MNIFTVPLVTSILFSTGGTKLITRSPRSIFFFHFKRQQLIDYHIEYSLPCHYNRCMSHKQSLERVISHMECRHEWWTLGRAFSARVTVVVSVCLSHLTSGASVRPENSVTYSAGNGGRKICVVFTETAPFKSYGVIWTVHKNEASKATQYADQEITSDAAVKFIVK